MSGFNPGGTDGEDMTDRERLQEKQRIQPTLQSPRTDGRERRRTPIRSSSG